MPALPIVVAALAVLAVGAALLRHIVRLRRALVAERAARRLLGRMHARDMQVCTDRLNAELGLAALFSEADRILDTALATYTTEGGRS